MDRGLCQLFIGGEADDKLASAGSAAAAAAAVVTAATSATTTATVVAAAVVELGPFGSKFTELFANGCFEVIFERHRYRVGRIGVVSTVGVTRVSNWC